MLEFEEAARRDEVEIVISQAKMSDPCTWNDVMHARFILLAVSGAIRLAEAANEEARTIFLLRIVLPDHTSTKRREVLRCSRFPGESLDT